MPAKPVRVVISQPMFFPWIGLFEQINLADFYVHYSDVQFSKGSFVNRVQLKTAAGPRWLTVPLSNLHLGQTIADVKIDLTTDWKTRHRTLLLQSYSDALFCKEMLQLVDSVYDIDSDSIDVVSKKSISAICDFFDLGKKTVFLEASQLEIPGNSTQRVLNIVRKLGGTHYITGWGARHYLDHSLFEAAGIQVEYMSYRMTKYTQLHGEFTPYVSTLDLIANLGVEGRRIIGSPTTHWKDFLNERN